MRVALSIYWYLSIYAISARSCRCVFTRFFWTPSSFKKKIDDFALGLILKKSIFRTLLQGAPTVSADVMRCSATAAITEALCVEMTRTESSYSSVFRMKGYDS